MRHRPVLEMVEQLGIVVFTDTQLLDRHGVRVAFTTRTGGVSQPPYDTLNLATHVGDDPESVDRNRTLVLDALGIGDSRERLTTAEQVHGDDVHVIGIAEAGAGAFASSGRPPIEGCDALVTREAGIPLMMMYADCVPVVLVATSPRRAVAVVHAGWRGVLSGLAVKTARALIGEALASASDVLAYIGPYVGPCCYSVDEGRLSQFGSAFATISAVEGALDLGLIVREQLESSGVRADAIASLGMCTSDCTDRFFSYRASGVTGRHAALGAIAKGD